MCTHGGLRGIQIGVVINGIRASHHTYGGAVVPKVILYCHRTGAASHVPAAVARETDCIVVNLDVSAGLAVVAANYAIIVTTAIRISSRGAEIHVVIKVEGLRPFYNRDDIAVRLLIAKDVVVDVIDGSRPV